MLTLCSVFKPEVKKYLCDVAIHFAFGQPFAKVCTRKYVAIILFVKFFILEVQTIRNIIFRKEFIDLTFIEPVAGSIILMQSFSALILAPSSFHRKESQKALDQVSSHAQILYVVIFASISTTEKDQIIPKICRIRRKREALPNLKKVYCLNTVALWIFNWRLKQS